MAKFRNGYESISCKLITPADHFNDIAKQAWGFGAHGEFYTGRDQIYDPNNEDVKHFINDIIIGRTFPKFCLEGVRVAFKINNISRVCLAQLTRERGFFCSESGDVKPLTQELIIPKAMYARKDWMERLDTIYKDLEDLYVDMALEGITYMESRYIMPHCQTISIAYDSSFGDWCRSCNTRTENNFADEINLIFRQMKYEIEKILPQLEDENSRKLVEWMLKSCDKKKGYTRDETYNNDFKRFPDVEGHIFPTPAHNDWRKSSWKIELENLYRNEPHLLLEGEKEMIEKWLKIEAQGKELPSTFNKDGWWSLSNRIKDMPYYRKEDKRDDVEFTENLNITSTTDALGYRHSLKESYAQVGGNK